MTNDDDRVPAVQRLLERAGDAHHVFERDELGGVYDAEWADWYGQWAVEHGLGEILGHQVRADEVGAYFERTWAEAQASGATPTEPWARWIARRVVSEL